MQVSLKIEISKVQINQIRLLAGFGLSQNRIAAVLGISTRLYFYWKSSDDRVPSAYETGKAKAELAVAKSLYQQAVAGNLAAIIWYERTRHTATVEIKANVTLDQAARRGKLAILRRLAIADLN